MPTAEALMTAEEFGNRPDPGHPEELVRGRIVLRKYADLRHGMVCGNVLGRFDPVVRAEDLGRLIALSGIVTERDPDTVRGVDVSFYGYDRMPRGPIPEGYADAMPEWAVEVVSAFDRWADVLAKVAELLTVGVGTVVVLDPDPRTAHVFGADEPPLTLDAEDELTLPGVLDGFRMVVGRFFE